MKLLVYVRMVLWAMMGIRGNSAASKDFGKVGPLALVLTFVFLLFVLGLGLWGLAHLAVAVSPAA